MPLRFRGSGPRKDQQRCRRFGHHQPFLRLRCGVRTTRRTYHPVYVQHGVHGLMGVCQSLSLTIYAFLSILMLILLSAPKQCQGAGTQAKPGGSSDVQEVLGSTNLSPRAPVGAELLLGESDRSRTEQEKFGVFSMAGSRAEPGLSLRKIQQRAQRRWPLRESGTNRTATAVG